MQFSQIYWAFGGFNSSKQILLVTIFFIGFFADQETVVFFHYWICCKQRFLSELAWCARNKMPSELQKKVFAATWFSFSLEFRNFAPQI